MTATVLYCLLGTVKFIMNLFDDFISGININNPQFEKTAKVHDWRNYVPYEWQDEILGY